MMTTPRGQVKKERKEPLNVRVDPGLKKAVEALARREKRSLAAQVEALLERAVQRCA